jgi:hypothetical protein
MRFRDAADLGVFTFIVSLMEGGALNRKFSRPGFGGLGRFFFMYIYSIK